jgi:protein-disulfide isomerase
MTINRRDAIKAQRTKNKRQQRMRTVIGVGGFILLVILVLISPSIYNALKPAGSFTRITPVAYPLEKGKTVGDPNAKVKIEVYADFQCPACKQFSDSVEKQLFQSTYISSGQVYIEFMNWPFIDSGSINKESHQSANAAMCANEQGHFWDYHDILFTNQSGENLGAFTDKRLQAFAESLGLDMKAFNQCFSKDKYKNEIEAEYQKGITLKVDSTPTVFVNGQMVTPGFIPSYEQLKSAIDTALASGG